MTRERNSKKEETIAMVQIALIYKNYTVEKAPRPILDYILRIRRETTLARDFTL